MAIVDYAGPVGLYFGMDGTEIELIEQNPKTVGRLLGESTHGDDLGEILQEAFFPEGAKRSDLITKNLRITIEEI